MKLPLHLQGPPQRTLALSIASTLAAAVLAVSCSSPDPSQSSGSSDVYLAGDVDGALDLLSSPALTAAATDAFLARITT